MSEHPTYVACGNMGATPVVFAAPRARSAPPVDLSHDVSLLHLVDAWVLAGWRDAATIRMHAHGWIVEALNGVTSAQLADGSIVYCRDGLLSRVSFPPLPEGDVHV